MSRATENRFAVRALDRPHANRRIVDGAWWPHTLTLEDEVSDLIASAARAGFDTRYITYCLEGWATRPRKVVVDDMRIKLGGYRGQAEHTITLIDGSDRGRLEIVVVPPDTPYDVARRALAAASDVHGGDDPADEILTCAYR
ncbi:MAG: hypothetical protein INR66_26805 [Gordonia polyisoprenivorans]|nr:hypothetical protein [Gordonia polyisoprenivorans]